MQKYNLWYVLCKSCTKVLCIENANWWYLYAKMRSAMCYMQKIRCYVICKMTISYYVLCKIKWPLLCAMCWKMASAMCYVKPLEGPHSFFMAPRPRRLEIGDQSIHKLWLHGNSWWCRSSQLWWVSQVRDWRCSLERCDRWSGHNTAGWL